jgi:N-acyl-L-homoserine lactone synthetase
MTSPTKETLNPSIETDLFENKDSGVTFWVGQVATPERVILPNVFTATRRLRASVYIAKRYLPESARQTDGGEADTEDERAYQFSVLERCKDEDSPATGQVIGTARLILKGQEGLSLPVEVFFPEVFSDHPAPTGSFEASRFIAEHTNPRIQHAVSLILMQTMSAYAHIDGPSSIYAVIEESLAHYFERVGIPFQRLAAAKTLPEYGGSENLPSVFDPRSVIKSIQTSLINAKLTSWLTQRSILSLDSAQHEAIILGDSPAV